MESTHSRYQNTSDQLKDLVAEFKTLYNDKGPHDFSSQIPYLEKIADYYQSQDDWPSLLRAHSLYVSCAVRKRDSQYSKFTRKAYETQLRYWSDKVNISTYDQQLRITQTLKEKLKVVRDKYMEQLSHYKDLFSNLSCDPEKLQAKDNQVAYNRILTEIPVLARNLNDEILLFCKCVIEQAVAVCGSAPCSFSVVAMGSLARGETTPYSDLEFMFLLEKRYPTAISYFERLALTVYFLIGNLGETKLRYMAIPELMYWNSAKNWMDHWFDDVAMNGFKIDGLSSGAGNIPTGNGEEKQCNHFICTVKELADRYKTVLDHPDEKESLRGDLTAMLASTVHIFGEHELHDNLRELIEQCIPNSQRQVANSKMLSNDAEKFDFSLNDELTRLKNVKFDIYRYPSLLILDLKLLFGVQSLDPWTIVDELEAKGVLADSAARCLRFCLCCGVYTRLATYFYHNSQKETISVLGSDPAEDSAEGCWPIPRSLLVHMFINLMPLKKGVTRAMSVPSFIIHAELTPRLAIHAMALVNYFCGDYSSVVTDLNSEYPGNAILETDPSLQWTFLLSAIEAAEFSKASMLLESKIRTGLADAFDYILMGKLCKRQHQLDMAVECYQKSLHKFESMYKKDHCNIAVCCNNIASVLASQGNYHQALLFHNRALTMRLRLYAGKDNEEIATSYNNIGHVLQCQGEYERATEYCMRAFEMRVRIFGNRDHINVITSCNSIGIVSLDNGDYQLALVYFKRALDMNLRLRGERAHTDMVSAYNNLGFILHQLGRYEEAARHYGKALDMAVKLFSDIDHAITATTCNNFGRVFEKQGNYQQALELQTKALEMQQRMYGVRDHVEIARSYNHIGVVLRGQGHYGQSFQYSKMAVDMRLRVLGEKDHRDIATSLNELGNVLNCQQKFSHALDYQNKALNMRLRLLHGKDHADLATSYRDIGLCYHNQQNYTVAITNYKKALEIWQRVFQDDNHPEVSQTRKKIREIENKIGNQMLG